jgi:hypothetical protein
MNLKPLIGLCAAAALMTACTKHEEPVPAEPTTPSTPPPADTTATPPPADPSMTPPADTATPADPATGETPPASPPPGN